MKLNVKHFSVINTRLYYVEPGSENVLQRLDLGSRKLDVFETGAISGLHKDPVSNTLYFSRGQEIFTRDDLTREIKKTGIGFPFRDDLFFLVDDQFFIQSSGADEKSGPEVFHLVNLEGDHMADAKLPFQMPAEVGNGFNKLYLKPGPYAGQFTCFNRKLSQIWSRDFSVSHRYKNILGQEESGRVDDTFIIAEKHSCIVLMVWGSAFMALHPDTGDTIWETKIESDHCEFCFDEDFIYIFDYDQHYYIVSIQTGEIILRKEVRNNWKQKGVRNLFTRFSKYEDVVYFCVSRPECTLVEVDAGSGEITRTLRLEVNDNIPEHITSIVTPKYIVQYAGYGQLHIIDRDTFTYAR